jgi:hypothetical protein
MTPRTTLLLAKLPGVPVVTGSLAVSCTTEVRAIHTIDRYDNRERERVEREI